MAFGTSSLPRAATSKPQIADSIAERFLLLAKYPNIGRRRDEDLRPGLRTFPVGEYLVVYRRQDDDVLILRVLRGSRDLESVFSR